MTKVICVKKLQKCLTHAGVVKAMCAGTLNPKTGKLAIDRKVFRELLSLHGWRVRR